MIIESLTIKNFRQFREEQCLVFSTSSEKNITVVHGANGSGKTSLLNAFKWCFYGETDFDTSTENILNKSAIFDSDFGSTIELKISVCFRHEEKKYTAQRVQHYRVLKDFDTVYINESIFTLEKMDNLGQTVRQDLPEVRLKSILPKDLQSYFFFNGERIEHISSVNQTAQIQEAIKRLMGLEIVDRSKKHLKSLKSIYNKQLQTLVGGEEKILMQELDQYEQQIEFGKSFVKKSASDISRLSNNIITYEADLKKYEKSRAAQEERESLQDQKDRNQDEISVIIQRQCKLLNRYAFIKISKGLFDSCHQLIEDNRKKGFLPYRINQNFISDRIEMGECICGHEIIPGSIYHKNLLKAKVTASTEDADTNYTIVNGLTSSYESEVKKFDDDYLSESVRYQSLLEANKKIDNDVKSAGAKISGLNIDHITELENKRLKDIEARGKITGEKEAKENEVSTLESNVAQINVKLANLKVQETEKSQSDRAFNYTSKMIETLDSLTESLVGQVRGDLSKRVETTFKSIIRKPVRAIIDDDYTLQVLETGPDGVEYKVSEQSTGERQVTSLSFIASIISLAKEKHDSKEKSNFFHGGLYPLVMDSPFGSLDDDYREKIASNVSVLAEQVVIFVSNSQWTGKVKEACNDKVGMSYKLIYNSPDVEEGEENEYVRRSKNQFEYSTLEEIKNDF